MCTEDVRTPSEAEDRSVVGRFDSGVVPGVDSVPVVPADFAFADFAFAVVASSS